MTTIFILVNGIPLSWHFCQAVPAILKNTPQLQIDNTTALQMNYIRLKDDPGVKNMREEMREEVKAVKQGGVGMLVNLFDWVDGLDPQPTMAAVPIVRDPRVLWPTSPFTK